MASRWASVGSFQDVSALCFRFTCQSLAAVTALPRVCPPRLGIDYEKVVQGCFDQIAYRSNWWQLVIGVTICVASSKIWYLDVVISLPRMEKVVPSSVIALFIIMSQQRSLWPWEEAVVPWDEKVLKTLFTGFLINILSNGPACTLCSLCIVSLTVGNYCLLKTLRKTTHVTNNGCIISIISLCEGRKCSLLLPEDYSKSRCSSAATGRRAIITIFSYWQNHS